MSLKVGDKVRIINAAGGGFLRRKLLNCETYVTKVNSKPDYVKLNINHGTDWWDILRLKKINDK